MTDAWPGTLPQVMLVEGFQQGVGDTRIRANPETGPAQVRPRSSANIDPLKVSMNMTTAQWAALKTFGRTTLLRWSLPFTFPDPDGGSALLVRFGANLPSRGPLSPHVPDMWRVALDLEVLP